MQPGPAQLAAACSDAGSLLMAGICSVRASRICERVPWLSRRAARASHCSATHVTAMAPVPDRGVAGADAGDGALFVSLRVRSRREAAAKDAGGDALQVVPIYAALPPEAQARVFEPAPAGTRKVTPCVYLAVTPSWHWAATHLLILALHDTAGECGGTGAARGFGVCVSFPALNREGMQAVVLMLLLQSAVCTRKSMLAPKANLPASQYVYMAVHSFVTVHASHHRVG